MSATGVFCGCVPALMTPCSASGEIDFDALVEKGRELVGLGMRAVVYCGSMGDWPLLTDEQRQDGVQRLVDAKVPVVVGTGAQNSRLATQHAAHAQEVGAAGLMVIPRVLSRGSSAAAQRAHFARILAAADQLPAVIYNSPYYGFETRADLFFDLRREFSNLVGFKEFGGADSLTYAAEHITSGDDDLALMVGVDTQVYHGFVRCGAVGAITGVGNALPLPVLRLVELCEQAATGDLHARRLAAAYIYATLLGDNSSAALVLADGGYYREAALLYRDKLNDKRRAAECLLKGGLWSDAVEIYTELADWPAVAGVYEKLEDHEGARQAWQAASAAYVSAGNFLQAANVQEERLDDAVAAEELLVRGWENSSADRDCLRELFGLFERTNNHHKSREWVSDLSADQRLSVRQQREVAGLFANLSHRYPDADLRADAFRHSREIVARRIRHTTDTDRRQLLSILEELIHADRLLGRDCRRYAQQQKTSGKPATTGGLQLVDQFHLRSDVEWNTATNSGKSVFVAGFSGDSLVVATWTQERQPTVNYHTFRFAEERRNRILLVPSSEQSARVLLHVCQATDTEVLEMNLHHGASHIRPLPFFDRTIVAAGTGRDVKICTLNAGHEGVELRGYLERGAPVSRWVLPLEITSMEPDAFVKPFGGDIVVCVVENTIAVVRPKPVADSAVTPEDRAAPVDINQFWLVGQACGMSAVDNSEMPRVAITTREGGIIHWVHSGHEEPFGADLQDPVCNFMINEDLVVASANGELEVYRTRNSSVTLRTRHDATGEAPIAVLRGVPVNSDHNNEFLVIRVDGRVDVWSYRA